MSSFFVLTSSKAECWNHYLSKIKDVDVYFTAEYCKIHENNGDGLAQLFVYEEGDQLVCYPYLLRRINDLKIPNIGSFKNDLYDIITPYGYGGPITNLQDVNERQNLFERFSKVFEGYCQENNIVSEFVRFHPIIKNYEYYKSVNPEMIQNTVCMELSTSDEETMDSLRNKCRNRLKFALNHGLTVSKEEPNNLEVFIKQYYAAMEKNQANSYYFFTENYFNDSVNLLPNHIDLFSVKFEGKIIVSTLFIHYNDFVSYHLTGSDKDFLKYAPYNLVIYYAACWYGKMGYKTLHLGGGYLGNEDELFRFKKTFTKKELTEFYVGRKIHCPEIYHTLTSDIEVTQDYFPLYRHPKLKVQTLLNTN